MNNFKHHRPLAAVDCLADSRRYKRGLTADSSWLQAVSGAVSAKLADLSVPVNEAVNAR